MELTPRRRTLLTWGIPGALVLAISIGLTIRQVAPPAPQGPERVSGSRVVLSMPSLLIAPRLPARVRVAVIRDRAAEDFYDSAAMLDSIVAAWRDALRATGADVRVVRSSELDRAADARVLVVPSSPCLTVETREAMDRAGERGQGLVVTGVVGTHDAGCRRIGYGLLVAMTGAARAEVVGARPMVYVTVPDGGPLSADVPPGTRIAADPAAQVALRGGSRDAIYTTYDGRPAPADGREFLDAAITRGTYRQARVVHWGFEPRNVVDRAWDREAVLLLVRNTIAWAAGIPLAAVEPWPDGHRAAGVIAQDVAASFANARYAADSLEAAGVPSTFFLTTRLALRHRRLSRRLLRIGEVGSHGEHQGLLGALPEEEQRKRLLATQGDLRRIADTTVPGLRPPEEQFDRATFTAWIAAGGRYVFGANDGRAIAPELLDIAGDTLVLVPRTGVDDFAALRRSTAESRPVASVFRDEFRHAHGLGGLFTLSYHSQLLAHPENIPLLARLARDLSADSSVWFATAGEVAAWWHARARIRAVARIRGSDRIDVTVRNPGPDTVSGAVVRIMLPPRRRAVAPGGMLLPAEPGLARVPFPNLPPGGERTLSLTLGRQS